MDNVNVIVAENLKRVRMSKGWSQAFVANQLGIAQRTISRAECGCGISKRTLKMLCSFYQVEISALYENWVQESSKERRMISDDVATALLLKNSFVQDLQREVVLRYTDVIQKEALMMRDDIEKIIPEALTIKKTYSLSDVITACMAVNQKILCSIRNLALV